MPVLPSTSYNPPPWLRNGHVQTIWPALFRRIDDVVYRRKRIETPDGDFIDLDFSLVGAQRLGILAHGLEGHSDRSYVKGMARALNALGWDSVAWNFRGCSGEPNRTLRFYHSGDTRDLQTVLEAVSSSGSYEALSLVGFSMGGNVILKFLGEKGNAVDPLVRAAVAYSVPCDLAAAAHQMARRVNVVYMKRFLKSLRKKIAIKTEQFPGRISLDGFGAISSFKEFDERYTAPLHGFTSAEDYWARASSEPLLRNIAVPALLVNALDDPFLAASCFPHEAARESRCLHLETPRFGGHVGFLNPFDPCRLTWSEKRAMEFLSAHA